MEGEYQDQEGTVSEYIWSQNFPLSVLKDVEQEYGTLTQSTIPIFRTFENDKTFKKYQKEQKKFIKKEIL